jgi:hypothetical protein
MPTKENYMPRYLPWVALALGLLFTTQAATADSLIFTVTPTDVSGPAGTTVGWGFSITNTSSTDFLDISGIDSDPFLATDGTPDASIFPFLNPLAPGQAVTQLYDPVGGLGLFQFTWSLGLAAGTTETGQFRLFGAFCDPVDQYCAEDGSVTSTSVAAGDYTATVIPASGTPVSEPSSILLLLSALCTIGFWNRVSSCRSPRCT